MHTGVIPHHHPQTSTSPRPHTPTIHTYNHPPSRQVSGRTALQITHFPGKAQHPLTGGRLEEAEKPKPCVSDSILGFDKIPDEVSLRVSSGSGFRLPSIRVGTSRWQELEASGHSAPAVKKKREASLSTQLVSL